MITLEDGLHRHKYHSILYNPFLEAISKTAVVSVIYLNRFAHIIINNTFISLSVLTRQHNSMKIPDTKLTQLSI